MPRSTFGRLTTALGVTTAAKASTQYTLPPGPVNCTWKDIERYNTSRWSEQEAEWQSRVNAEKAMLVSRLHPHL
jgi:hypothetical protein